MSKQTNQYDHHEVYEVLKYLALVLVEAIDAGDAGRIEAARANYDNTRAMYDAQQAELAAFIASYRDSKSAPIS